MKIPTERVIVIQVEKELVQVTSGFPSNIQLKYTTMDDKANRAAYVMEAKRDSLYRIRGAQEPPPDVITFVVVGICENCQEVISKEALCCATCADERGP
jgi:hypothetical protein